MKFMYMTESEFAKTKLSDYISVIMFLLMLTQIYLTLKKWSSVNIRYKITDVSII